MLGDPAAAAEAWAYAEREGKTLVQGETARRPSSPKMGEDGRPLIKDPPAYFADAFGSNPVYVKQARALLAGDPAAAAEVKASNKAGLGKAGKVRFLLRKVGCVAKRPIWAF